MTFVGLDYVDVRVLDPAIYRQILAEIRTRDRLVELTFNQCLVGLANPTITVGVADEETKGNVAMELSIAVDVLGPQGDNLCAGHAGKLRRHAVPTEGNGPNCGGPAKDTDLPRSNRSIEGKDSVVSGGTTTFYRGDPA